MKIVSQLIAVFAILVVFSCRDSKKTTEETATVQEVEVIEKQVEQVSKAIEKEAKDIEKELIEIDNL